MKLNCKKNIIKFIKCSCILSYLYIVVFIILITVECLNGYHFFLETYYGIEAFSTCFLFYSLVLTYIGVIPFFLIIHTVNFYIEKKKIADKGIFKNTILKDLTKEKSSEVFIIIFLLQIICGCFVA